MTTKINNVSIHFQIVFIFYCFGDDFNFHRPVHKNLDANEILIFENIN